MTEQVPENYDDIPLQYVTLDHPHMQTLFTPDGKVFYHLDGLVDQMAAALVPRILEATITQSTEDMLRCEGAKWVIESIQLSQEQLTAERERREAQKVDADSLETAWNLPDAERE